MSPRILLFVICWPLVLFAQGGSADDDPFGAYQRAVNDQLSAILEGNQSAIQPAVQPTTRVDQKIASSDGRENEIRVFSQRFWGGREDQLLAALDRLERLRPRLEPILESEGVPKQFVAVALVESAAQPTALSPRQARGLWQFIPDTARQYGLSINEAQDERINIEAATRAAARYLRDLHSRFRDWPLALAAYNAGEAAVEGALAKSKVRSFRQLSTGGWLPQETRNYVPAVLAATQLLGSERPSIPTENEPPRIHWVYASARVN